MKNKILKISKKLCSVIFVILILAISILLAISFINKAILVINEDDKNLKKHNSDESYVYTNLDSAEETSIKGAYLSISAPREYNGFTTSNEFNQSTLCSSVTVGDDIVFLLSYTGNINYINLKANSIVFNGFTSNIEIFPTTDDPQKIFVVLKGIEAPYTSDKISIAITGGTAVSSYGELSNSISSPSIVVYQSDWNRLILWILEESSSLGTFLAAIIALYVGINYSDKRTGSENT